VRKVVDGREIDEFYSALEVAEIKGLTKQAIIDGCKKGKYQGAIKTQPDRTNRQGLWLIPKTIIDNPPVPTVTPETEIEKVSLEDLKKDFRSIVSEEIVKHTDENRQQQLAIERAAQKRHNEMLDILLRQAQEIQQMKIAIEKPWWKFWS
jgi:hypothetical protein